MLKDFKEVIDKQFSFLYGSNIYLAISGGKDSMALSHLLTSIGIKHTLLHCNFQLRGIESDQDQAFIEEYARSNNLKIETIKFDTGEKAIQLKMTIQEVARELRYSWFQSFIKQENDFLLTAHHLNDSIETFFINLMRGTSISGLSGIEDNRNQIIRPLSHFKSNQIKQYITEHKISFREDSSNSVNKYLRNKLRNNILPSISESTEHFENKMDATMTSIKEADTFILSQVISFQKKHFQTNKDNTICIELNKLRDMEPFFVQRLFSDYDLTRKRTPSFMSFLLSSTGAKFETNQHQFHIDRNNLIIASEKVTDNIIETSINKFPTTLTINNIIIDFSIIKTAKPYSDPHYIQLNYDKIAFPITIRPYKSGDKITPLGMRNRKKISDILIDKKIPNYKKKDILICEDNEANILCVLGLLINNSYKMSPSNSSILCIDYSSLNPFSS